MRLRLAPLPALLLAALGLGCHTRASTRPTPTTTLTPGASTTNRAPDGENDEPVATLHIGGALRVGGEVSTRLGPNETHSFVVVLAGGAAATASLRALPGATIAVYGPSNSRGEPPPLVARGGATLSFVPPTDGAYSIRIAGPAGDATLSLACGEGDACRLLCGPDETCPDGAACAAVRCVRAPCPSYCQPSVSVLDLPSSLFGQGGTEDEGQDEGQDEAPPAPRPALTACERGGCGGELCHEPGREISSICVVRPEHACYAEAICERQPGGTCGFTETPDLRACLERARSEAAGPTIPR